MSDDALPEDDDELRDTIRSAPRNDGPGILWGWFEEEGMDIDTLRELLPEVWNMCEFPSLALDQEDWRELFGNATWWGERPPVSDPPGLPAPTEDLTVYRGATEQTALGMAWTTDPDKAGWFADRLGMFGFVGAGVYVAVVPPSGVWALIGARQEREVVVDPTTLIGLRRLEDRPQRELVEAH